MRALLITLCAALAVAGAGCSGSNTSSSGGSTAASASPAAADSAAAATDAASTSAPSSDAATDEKTKLPIYPGSTVGASAASNGQAGTVLTTADSFDKVYAWYKGKMPAGSEKAKASAGGIDTAVFTVENNGGKSNVSIMTQADKTTISLTATTS